MGKCEFRALCGTCKLRREVSFWTFPLNVCPTRSPAIMRVSVWPECWWTITFEPARVGRHSARSSCIATLLKLPVLSRSTVRSYRCAKISSGFLFRQDIQVVPRCAAGTVKRQLNSAMYCSRRNALASSNFRMPRTVAPEAAVLARWRSCAPSGPAPAENRQESCALQLLHRPADLSGLKDSVAECVEQSIYLNSCFSILNRSFGAFAALEISC